MNMRLQKFLAEAGVASRREGERMILDRRVAVNGHVVCELGTKVDSETDRVTVDGRPVKPRRKIYVAVHKPAGYICTCKDPEERRTIGSLLPKEWSTLYPVGRLDCPSEGLIFLTNDGDFCLRMTHPRYGIRKKYIAIIEGECPPDMVKRLVKGVVDEGQRLHAEKAKVVSAVGRHATVELELSEGKYREVRRLFATMSLTVLRLIRVQIGPIRLGELPQGKWRTLTETEIKSLLAQS